MVQGFAILLLLQFFGELLSTWMHLPIPGNVLGMIMLLCGLSCGLIRLEWVQEAADLLLSHLALFFVPAGVGVMVYFELIAKEWLPITVATVASTFVVLAATGWTAKTLEGKAGEDAR